MVHRGPGSRPDSHVTGGGRLVGRLEQGPVDDPDELPCVGIDQVETLGDLDARRAEQCAGRLGGTGREEDAVPWRGADVRGQTVAFGVGEVLGDRTGKRAVLADQYIGQPLVYALLGELLPAVQRAPRR